LYDRAVPDRQLLPDDLASLLERFSAEAAGSRLPAQVAESELELLLARVAALTELLRTAAANDTARVAARLLLADVAMAASRLRGQTNAVSETLTRALESLAAAAPPQS
jgi:hypothetical protein